MATRIARLSARSAEAPKQVDTAKLEARVAIARCYKHLYFPWADKANGYLRHLELTAKAQGEADKAQTKVILQTLTDEGKVRTQPLGTDYLRQKAWPRGAGQVTTSGVCEAFWRDHGMPMILDTTLLKDAIRDGVRNGSWVYYDVDAQRVWTSSDASATGTDRHRRDPLHRRARPSSRSARPRTCATTTSRT